MSEGTHRELHSVCVWNPKCRLAFLQVLWTGDLHGFRVLCTWELITACQLDTSPYNTTISKASLGIALMIGDNEMDMVEDIGGTLFSELVL